LWIFLCSFAGIVDMMQAASTSITSVLYLKDDVSIATSGAADKYAIFPIFSLCNYTYDPVTNST
jgi:hypothetical protein